jgi:transcriptional regulator with XRE-family HTH domain
MEDAQVGSIIRAIRIRRRLSQRDLAALAGVSSSTVSLVERGHLALATVATVRQLASALEMALPFAPRWRGAELAKLADQRHAELVGEVVAALRARGWDARPEVTFSRWGERGSIDVLGLRRDAGAALAVECKTQIADLQDLLSTMDRKRRLCAEIVAAEFGWRPSVVGTVLVMFDSSSARLAVARHAGVFAAALPLRTVAVRDWLADPASPLAGIWFLHNSDTSRRLQKSAAPQRVGRSRGSPRG